MRSSGIPCIAGARPYLSRWVCTWGARRWLLVFCRGSSEHHEIGGALFNDLECRGLALSKRILFVTDGGSGLLKASRGRFSKKLVQQRCVIHTNRNLQGTSPNPTATKPIASSPRRWNKRVGLRPSRCHRNRRRGCARRCYRSARSRASSRWSGTASGLFTRTRGSALLQRWLGTVLIDGVTGKRRRSLRPSRLSTWSRSPLRRRRQHETTMGTTQNISTNLLTASAG